MINSNNNNNLKNHIGHLLLSVDRCSFRPFLKEASELLVLSEGGKAFQTCVAVL